MQILHILIYTHHHGDLLDWDLTTVEATWESGTHFHIQKIDPHFQYFLAFFRPFCQTSKIQFLWLNIILFTSCFQSFLVIEGWCSVWCPAAVAHLLQRSKCVRSETAFCMLPQLQLVVFGVAVVSLSCKVSLLIWTLTSMMLCCWSFIFLWTFVNPQLPNKEHQRFLKRLDKPTVMSYSIRVVFSVCMC